ncbi:hypothetical protein B0J17DRAFT_261035 [Rhizoctonia solani]|nr:hypothetical protein B0J17DRAFT_261035 [Rhizoctonia solani]
MISTGRSECAYTLIVHGDHSFVPQGVHSHPLHAKLHHRYSPPKIEMHAPPRTDAEAYRHSRHTSLTNGSDRSRGSLMDRRLNVDHPLTSSVLQPIASEEPTLQTTHSKSTNSLGPIYNTTAECPLLAKEPRTNHGDLPSRHEFTAAIDAYLSALSWKKRPKALVTQQLYEDIIFNLKCEKDSLPGIGTPQFRFWCRKHFILQTIPRLRLREQADIPHSAIALPIGNQDGGDPEGEVEVVTHNGQPVVTRESIYDVLTKCHTLANHAGRDKTTAIVKQNYSWVPKVLIGDFIKLCPVCCSKKVAGVTWTHSHSKPDLTPLSLAT